MKLRRAVVTGVGAVTPLGNNIPNFWEALIAGKSGAGSITRFDPINHKVKFACFVKDFDPTVSVDKKEIRKMDLYCRYAFVASDECIANSGIDLNFVDKNRIGVIWASGIGGLETIEEEMKYFYTHDEVPKFNPFYIPKIINNIASGMLSIRYGFGGLSFAPVAACASSSQAIADAYNYIRLGKADIILAGGSEASITPVGVGGFSAMRALSERNDDPQAASRPFDKDRDGFVMGEGAGALFIEELDHALARGAKIYAEVVGSGFSSDAYHLTAPCPDGDGAYRAMADALNDAEMLPEEVDYINAHATSTPLGDIAETKAIAKLFNGSLDKLHISGTKSMTGHLQGAAGALEGIIATLAVHHDVVPPTINLQNRDENIPAELNLTPLVAVRKTVNVAMSNTFGFGGHNIITLFKKFKN
jgi:3-oxoacyl-[acyl-carrier-protein] synthase II